MENWNQERIAKRFAELTANGRWSLRGLAAHLPVSYQTVGKVIKGRVRTEKEKILFRQILEVMGISEDMFWNRPKVTLPEPKQDEGLGIVSRAYLTASPEDQAGMRWLASHILSGGKVLGVAIEDRKPRPVKTDLKLANRRHEIKRIKVKKRKRPSDYVRAEVFDNLAAGGGGVLEVSDDYYYVPRLSISGKGPTALARIRGDSMLETLIPGDMVILRALNGREGILLPSLAKGKRKRSLSEIRKHIEDDSIVVLSIDGGDATIKRVLFQGGKTDEDWHLQIVADNPSEWRAMVATKEHEIRFLATLEGFADEED